MRTRYADPVLAAHERAKQFGALHHGDAGGIGCIHLRVALRHGGRDQDDIRPRHVLCPVAAEHRDTPLRQRLGHLVGALIRTGNHVAALEQESGDGRQPRAADPDEMKVGRSFP